MWLVVMQARERCITNRTTAKHVLPAWWDTVYYPSLSVLVIAQLLSIELEVDAYEWRPAWVRPSVPIS